MKSYGSSLRIWEAARGTESTNATSLVPAQANEVFLRPGLLVVALSVVASAAYASMSLDEFFSRVSWTLGLRCGVF